MSIFWEDYPPAHTTADKLITSPDTDHLPSRAPLRRINHLTKVGVPEDTPDRPGAVRAILRLIEKRYGCSEWNLYAEAVTNDREQIAGM